MEHKIIELERFIQKLTRLGIPEHRLGVFEFRPHCKHPSRVLDSLWRHLDKAIPETARKRRGMRHRQATVLTFLAIAELNLIWVWGQDGFWRYVKSLTPAKRRALRCWQHPKTGRLTVPSLRTFRRVVRSVPAEQLKQAVFDWLVT